MKIQKQHPRLIKIWHICLALNDFFINFLIQVKCYEHVLILFLHGFRFMQHNVKYPTTG